MRRVKEMWREKKLGTIGEHTERYSILERIGEMRKDRRNYGDEARQEPLRRYKERRSWKMIGEIRNIIKRSQDDDGQKELGEQKELSRHRDISDISEVTMDTGSYVDMEGYVVFQRYQDMMC